MKKLEHKIEPNNNNIWALNLSKSQNKKNTVAGTNHPRLYPIAKNTLVIFGF